MRLKNTESSERLKLPKGFYIKGNSYIRIAIGDYLELVAKRGNGMICRHCGKEYSDEFSYCPYCAEPKPIIQTEIKKTP